MLDLGNSGRGTRIPPSTSMIFLTGKRNAFSSSTTTAMSRPFLTELLSIDGFLTDVAHSVNEAIQRLNDNTYQMVLSDLRMPGLSGQDLVRYVSTHYPDTAVMMITGEADVHSAVEALTAGAYDYLTKPFTVAELQSKVFRALERRQLILQNRQYQSHLEQSFPAADSGATDSTAADRGCLRTYA